MLTFFLTLLKTQFGLTVIGSFFFLSSVGRMEVQVEPREKMPLEVEKDQENLKKEILPVPPEEE